MREEKLFNDYYDSFKKLPIKEKMDLINTELKELLRYVVNLNKSLKLDDRILYNKEMFDVEYSKENIDLFINSLFIYIHSIEESLGIYMDAIYKVLYKESEEKND